MNVTFLINLAAIFFFGADGVAESKLFPEVEGWKMQEDLKVYHTSDLWELIDGAAEAYISYDFVDLHLAEYTRTNEILRVEIYHHNTPEDAYGIYSSERMPDYPQVNIGAQGYKSTGVLNFLAGPYYVKIMTIGRTDVAEEDIVLLARKVNEQLGQPGKLPAVLDLLPLEGKEFLSDMYVSSDFMGYNFFHSAFTARYRVGDISFQLFVINNPNERLQEIIEKYKAAMKESQVVQKENMYIFNDPFNGKVFISVRNNYLAGVLNTDNESVAREYINKFLDAIP